MVVVVAQQKGGVGKTTTAANVGVLLARRSGRVLLVDSDPQCALTRQLGLEGRPGDLSLVDVLAGCAVALTRSSAACTASTSSRALASWLASR